MTRLERRMILCGAVLFFLLTVPAILLYAWGYGFDWQRGKPVLTGGFHFSSIPKKAEVYINGELGGLTPLFVTRLKPYSYQIVIEKEGFRPWSKKLRVESKLITNAHDVLLIPVNPRVETIELNLPADFAFETVGARDIEIPDDNYFTDSNGYVFRKIDTKQSRQISEIPMLGKAACDFFALSDEKIAGLDGNGTLYILDTETKSFKKMAQNVQAIQFSDDEEKLLYLTPSEIWVYYFENAEENIKKMLITRLSQTIKKTVWNDLTDEHIIFLTEEEIKVIELDSRDVRNTIDVLKISADDIAYNERENKIYVIKGKELLSISLEN